MFFVARLVEHNSHIEDLCEPTRRHDENPENGDVPSVSCVDDP
jgi:hypothetical protein